MVTSSLPQPYAAVADMLNQRLVVADHQQRAVLFRCDLHQQFNGLLLGQQIEA